MIQIDIPMPKCCALCPISSTEEDYNGDWFYYCRLTKEALYGKKYYQRRFRRCPLQEVKENKE